MVIPLIEFWHKQNQRVSELFLSQSIWHIKWQWNISDRFFFFFFVIDETSQSSFVWVLLVSDKYFSLANNQEDNSSE